MKSTTPVKTGTKWSVAILLSLICVAFICTAGCSGTGSAISTEELTPVDGNLTLIGKDGTEMTLTYDDLTQLPAHEGHGYGVSTVGIKYGPYICKGVKLTDLAGLVGGLEENDSLWASAPDGYLWVYDHRQATGNDYITLNEDLQEIPTRQLTPVLMYEIDGRPLEYNEGAPFRIAILSEEPGIVTEGSCWVKWVDTIEVK